MKNFNGLIARVFTFFIIFPLVNTKYTAKFYQESESTRRDARLLETYLTQLNSIASKLNITHTLPPFNKSSTSIMTVTPRNVYRISHITNILLSCEYSKITYSYIALIDKCFLKCTSDIQAYRFTVEEEKLVTINQCFDTYHTQLLDNIINHVKTMIYTLGRLMDFTSNVVFKYHDVFRTLLTCYLYMEKMFSDKILEEVFEQRMSRLNLIIITNFQIKHRLERYMVMHCYSTDHLNSIVEQIHQDIHNPLTINKFLPSKYVQLQIMTYPHFENIKDDLILNPTKPNFGKLILLLNGGASPNKIKISWNSSSRDLNEIFETDIKYNTNITEILQYEMNILDVILEIIRLKILKEINTEEEIEEKRSKCDDLLDKMYKFKTKIKINDQSLYLVNTLTVINSDMSELCSRMKHQIDEKIMNSNVDVENAFHAKRIMLGDEISLPTNFENFLESLSEMIIYAKLHPVILNAFWRQLMLYDT